MSIALQRQIADWKVRRDESFVRSWPGGGRAHRWRFIIFRGVGLWGLPILSVSLAIIPFFYEGDDRSFPLLVMAICTPAILGLGILYGWVQWHIMERAYKKLTLGGQEASLKST
jgi:hypothetical protein